MYMGTVGVNDVPRGEFSQIYGGIYTKLYNEFTAIYWPFGQTSWGLFTPHLFV